MCRGEDGAPNKPREDESVADAEKPFDLWLKRGLHQLFDDVANEPIPEELLRLIEDDRDDGSP